MKAVMRKRLDQALVDRGLAASRSRARDVVLRGLVEVAGVAVRKAGYLVDDQDEISIDDASGLNFVSRGALKLQAALDAFQFPVRDRVALDIGASTGGFTEVLLRLGAKHVFAVDVGQGQMANTVRGDSRVSNLEQYDCRTLTSREITVPIEALVADVSFISLSKALARPLTFASSQAWMIALIKPQFEVGKEGVGKSGVVKDNVLQQQAIDQVRGWLAQQPGWQVRDVIPSPILGGSGNTEYLIGGVRDDI